MSAPAAERPQTANRATGDDMRAAFEAVLEARADGACCDAFTARAFFSEADIDLEALPREVSDEMTLFIKCEDGWALYVWHWQVERYVFAFYINHCPLCGAGKIWEALHARLTAPAAPDGEQP